MTHFSFDIGESADDDGEIAIQMAAAEGHMIEVTGLTTNRLRHVYLKLGAYDRELVALIRDVADRFLDENGEDCDRYRRVVENLVAWGAGHAAAMSLSNKSDPLRIILADARAALEAEPAPDPKQYVRPFPAGEILDANGEGVNYG